MQTHLSRNQRRGTAIFLGLCLVCLAATLWKNSLAPEPSPDPAAEAVLRERLNTLHTITDSLPDTGKTTRSIPNHPHPAKRTTPTKTKPKPVPPRSPLDEPVNAR